MSSPDTYYGAFEEISKYNVHLNFAEKAWAAWYTYMQNDVLATGIMSFAMHEMVYFGRSLPWIIADRLPYFNKYKIQNVSFIFVACVVHHADFFRSKKSQQSPNNGIAQVSFSSLTSPSNFPKSGSSILWHNSAVSQRVFLSHRSSQWPTKSQSSSSSKIPGTTGLTELCILLACTK